MTPSNEPGATAYSTPTDREILITRVVEAPRTLVFRAWTDPTQVPKWLLGPEGWTMPVCEIDLRPGGRWRHVWRKSDGTGMAMGGAYREVAPPGRLVTTESWGPGWPETLNTLVLADSGGRTTITLTVLYPTKEARDAALKTGMQDGMDQGFARLDSMLRAMA